ncbi:hypothetical protein PhaeoP18_03548 (plasmid) [Phaeobacter piscinae]|nr:hypothetical protein PhaeoP92_03725 [Phaeobacter inhibens]AUQ80359.1 hypothetical protein PhaeoP74_03726 [Phaeobacter inhibens]AUR17518.1 hypothetical protein PhaeoP70_03724 [Phaeobacter inhibens]AUR37766.1 hypothetical protein PhaeoP18_03548 [Phaeobacter piscinae]
MLDEDAFSCLPRRIPHGTFTALGFNDALHALRTINLLDQKPFVGIAHIDVLHPLWLRGLVGTDICLFVESWDQIPFSDASGCAENDEQACRCNDPHHSEAAFVATDSRFKNAV